MKKILIALFILCTSQTSVKEKTYTVVLNEQQLQTLWYVIGKSNAEHLTVVAIQDVIGKQIQPQMVDTTKKK